MSELTQGKPYHNPMHDHEAVLRQKDDEIKILTTHLDECRTKIEATTHTEAVLRQKDHEIEVFRSNLDDCLAKLDAANAELKRLQDAPKSEPIVMDISLRKHVELLEAALIGAGQEMGVHTIWKMVYRPEDRGPNHG